MEPTFTGPGQQVRAHSSSLSGSCQTAPLPSPAFPASWQLAAMTGGERGNEDIPPCGPSLATPMGFGGEPGQACEAGWAPFLCLPALDVAAMAATVKTFMRGGGGRAPPAMQTWLCSLQDPSRSSWGGGGLPFLPTDSTGKTEVFSLLSVTAPGMGLGQCSPEQTPIQPHKAVWDVCGIT